MLSDKRIKEAESNVKQYLAEGLLKKQENETAKQMYIENGYTPSNIFLTFPLPTFLSFFKVNLLTLI